MKLAMKIQSLLIILIGLGITPELLLKREGGQIIQLRLRPTKPKKHIQYVTW